MADAPAWPDPHAVLRLALADLGAAKIVGPRTPPDFRDDDGPVFAVRRIGGTNDKITDNPRMSVDVYAWRPPDEDDYLAYEASRDHAEAIRQRMISGPLRTTAGIIDSCQVEVSPILVPYSDPAVWVHSAVYRPSLRRL